MNTVFQEQSDIFNFHVPISIVEKGGDKKKEMVLGGIASTRDIDREGESLLPEGFDYKYLVNNGYINWHHQLSKNPDAVIGEPTMARVTPKGLYIEGKLYPNSDMAKKAYKLAKTLEDNSSNRRLGWSIEGKVIERDPANPRRVTKAKITGVALTPMPINPNTMVTIIKAMGGGDSEAYEVVPEELSANGGQEYIMDEPLKDGGYVKLNNQGEIVIHLGKGYSTTKAMNTTNASAIIPEDLEGDTKLTLQNKKDEEVTNRLLSKGETYEYIFREYPSISPTQARMIYNKITNNRNEEL